MHQESPALYDAGLWSKWGGGSATVLALHGMTGCGLDFRPACSGTPELDEGLSWLAPDLPGHAAHITSAEDAHRPPGGAVFTWFSTLDWLENAVRRLRFAGQTVHLLGYSMGGRLALALLARSPQLFDSAAIISASPGITRRSLRAQRRAADEAWAQKAEKLPLDQFMAEWKSQPILAGQLRLDLPFHSAEEKNRAQRLSAHTGQGLASALRAFSPGTAPASPERIHFYQPTLLITGELDLSYQAHAAELANRLPYPTLRVVPDSGHAPHLENPEAVGQVLAEFWKLKAAGVAEK